MKKFTNFWALSALLAFSFACDPESTPPIPAEEFEQGVLIYHEGNFNDRDGEVYHYNPENGELRTDIFEEKNRRPFAGLIQNVVENEGQTYLVSNTGKVEIVSSDDFESLGSVTEGLDVTRSVVVSGQTLYIADWGPYNSDFQSPSSYVAVVNGLSGGTISEKIPVSSRPESLFVSGSNLLVASAAGRVIDIISLANAALTQSIEVSGRPVKFFDVGGTLYLYARSPGEIYFHSINTTNLTVSNTITIAIANPTDYVTFTSANDALIVTSTGFNGDDSVSKISLSSQSVTAANIFEGSGFYGIGFDTARRQIYVADNNAFQGNGTVFILDESGQQLEALAAGRAPSGFLFK